MDLPFKRLGIVRNISFIFFSALIIQGSTLILYVVLARVLSIEEFATFRQLFLVQAILSGLFFGALPTSLLYFTGRVDSIDEKKRYLRAVVALTISIACILSLLIFLSRDLISEVFSNEQLKDVLPYFSLSPLGILLIALMPSCHVAIDRVLIQPYLASFIAAFVSIPCILIAIDGAILIEIVKLISLLYLMVGIGLSLLMLIVYGAVSDLADNFWLKVKQVSVYSWPLLAASALSIIGLKVDHLIVASLLGTLAYGLYSVGAFEIPVFNILQNSVLSVLMPKVTSLIKEGSFLDATTLWSATAHRTASITFPIALILMVNAEEIVSLTFGSKYEDAAVVFILFNSLAFVRVITFGMALRALNKNHVELAITFIYLGFGLLGSYYTASQFGVNGVASWVLFNTVLLSIILSVFTYRLTNGRLALWNIYPVRHLILALFILSLIRVTRDSTTKMLEEAWVVAGVNCALIAVIWMIFLKVFYREKIA